MASILFTIRSPSLRWHTPETSASRCLSALLPAPHPPSLSSNCTDLPASPWRHHESLRAFASPEPLASSSPLTSHPHSHRQQVISLHRPVAVALTALLSMFSQSLLSPIYHIISFFSIVTGLSIVKYEAWVYTTLMSCVAITLKQCLAQGAGINIQRWDARLS